MTNDAMNNDQSMFNDQGPRTEGRFDRIVWDPPVLNGQPCIKGTRLTVRRVLLALAQYSDREELRKDYPQLQDEDIKQAL